MNAKPTRILLIEDNPGDASLIREMLKEAGDGRYDLDLADRLSTGLERMAENLPDVTLLDLGLPDSHGLDTLSNVGPRANGMPVVVLTGLNDESVGIAAVQNGAQDYLVKGQIDGRGLWRVIHYAIERKRMEEALKGSLAKLQKAMEGTVNAMALTSEMRDPYTAGHQRRVARLSEAIAEEMGLITWSVQGLRVAAMIHDIGKIGVPAEILSEPGVLTGPEMSIVKTHAQVGYDILHTIEFPWPIAQIVRQHHERLDGSGYPLGLKGEDIMLEARILAVADVVEAMASPRPFRPAHGIEKALQEIGDKKGILYDLKVVDACIKLFTDKKFALEESERLQ